MTRRTSTPSVAGTSSSLTGDSLPGAVPTPKVLAIPLVENAHTMCTRDKMGPHILPSPQVNLQASTLSPLLKTYRGALADPN
jgi:hypothetical protein